MVVKEVGAFHEVLYKQDGGVDYTEHDEHSTNS